MREYYTRACNFFYGSEAKKLIFQKKAISLNSKKNVAFSEIELIKRINKKILKKRIKIKNLSKLNLKLKKIIDRDLKNIKKKVNFLNFNLTAEPLLMGVLNITPDSFSDGGLFFSKSKAFTQANLMLQAGAKIIDVGGESTRPGSKTIESKKEWNRIKKTIVNLKIKYPKILLSLDTRKSDVMKKGIECGIKIINDVSGLSFDKKSFEVINSKNIPFILHHMQGTPNTMQINPKYDDVLLDIYDFFEKKINFCKKKKI